MLWDPFLIPDRNPPLHNLTLGRHPLARLLGAPRPLPVEPRGPAMNLRASEEEARVTVLVPGLGAEDLDLTIEGDLLTVRGEFRPAAPTADGGSKLRIRERFQGSFARTLRLPFPVDREGTQAVVERGVLEVTLPRAAEDRPRRIEIQALTTRRPPP